MADPEQTPPQATRPKRAAKPKALFRRAPKRSIAALLVAVFIGYAVYLSVKVINAFEARRWDVPAHVYAAPLELYAGLGLTPDELVANLRQTGYEKVAALSKAGEYRVNAATITLRTREFAYWDARDPSQKLIVSFQGNRIAGVRNAANDNLPLVRLEPVRLGSLFAAHHEDRILVEPDEIPPLLLNALKTIEDRRFDRHIGIDFVAILRAALVNLRHGEIRQGGSTLTQQLVKSFFLDHRRTLWWKFREAIMAIALELRYDKAELLRAYVNEVYLGQQGARAIHGFGLASEYYFSRRLSQLDLPQIALLVGLVNGPSYFDPRRHPDRARSRRDWVLETLVDNGVIGAQAAREAAAQDLGIEDGAARTLSRYQPAFMDLVRQELASDYPPEVLERKALRVFTNLDPQVQSLAERQLADGLARLSPAGTTADAALEGAVVVTRYQTGDVIAMVGGRDVEYDGFNRALAARRQAGSLVKPVVYLAALQSGRYTLASTIDDAPITVPSANGERWSPENYSKTSHGEVPLLRALAESYNQATVRLGMEIGVDAVAHLLNALGLPDTPPANPSLLLGAVDTTPFEIAQVYSSLANGGFRVRLRAVRSVVDAEGKPLARYPLEMTPVADPAAVQQVDAALVQVIERGTARSARAILPAGVIAAGKTGTSSDLRDSWFAGFTNDYVAVVWVGRDNNTPSGLTGASGALRIWAPLISGLRQTTSYAPVLASGQDEAWLDYDTGLSTYEGCGDAVLVPLPHDSEPPYLAGCRQGLRTLGKRLRDFFHGRDPQ
jgi:penicillin-binding protein 1B